MKVHITPTWKGPDNGDGGIRRVVEAQLKYLPELDIGITDDPSAADLIACHGAAHIDERGVPMVCHTHGMMWEDYQFGEWGDTVNAQLIESMVRAQAITAPSQWVAHAIARGMLVSPEIIYHGVEVDEWAADVPHLGYVLWNKARIDPVSDPRDMQHLAALLPDVKFLTTYGQTTRNVLVTGVGTYAQMRPVVQKAGVYLATARETMGIGTLEALAAGVPIVGWDYGGQHEIVRDGETGYLAEFGDIDGLAAAVRRCLAERERLSANARRDAGERWSWKDKIARYADLYRRVVADWTAKRPKVSVIVTCYNLERYLLDALASVLSQTMKDYELLVVDDHSDDPMAVQRACIQGEAKHLRTPHNLGLSGARNFGFSHASGRYVLFLDADDMLEQNALDTLSNALDRDPGIHIAYGSLDVMAHDGSNRQRNPWPRGAFNWHAQLAHLNQPHGASLMRREVLERSGGYRTRDWRAEDASFWARVTSFGFRAAKVTDDTVQIYRMHEGQKSRTEDGDGDWTAWLPWRLAGSPDDGVAAMRAKLQPNVAAVPFGAQGTPPTPRRAWPVRHFQHPVVSIVIPVGPGHTAYVIDALDSVQAQTMVEWEAIVVNDTGAPLHLPGHPWTTVWEVNRLEGDDVRRMGAGGARNWGLDRARAPFVLFLDADDVLSPDTLELLLRAHIDSGGRYAYLDCKELQDETRLDGVYRVHEAADYDARRMLRQLYHAVTALIPTDWARDVGGFDEHLTAFEDWDFYAKLAKEGYHGVRVPHPLLTVRRRSGIVTRRAIEPRRADEADDAETVYTPLGQEVAAAIWDRYAAYLSGEEPMGSCCGSGPLNVASAALEDMLGFATGGAAPVPAADAPPVRMEFIGEQLGEQSFVGPKSGRVYRAGRLETARYHDVDSRDVEHLLSLSLFRIVPAPRPIEVAGAEATKSRVKGRRAG